MVLVLYRLLLTAYTIRSVHSTDIATEIPLPARLVWSPAYGGVQQCYMHRWIYG